jgi:multidrug efflux pump subunit AcrB
MNIAELSINNKVITSVMTLLLLVGGGVSFNELSRLEDPEFTIKEALVITEYPGASPREVELEVTDVLETELQRMDQVKEIRSVSLAGRSIITVEMKEIYDKKTLPAVWQQLRSKVGDAQRHLPPGVSESIVKDDFGDVFGVVYAVTGDGFSSREIYEHAKFLQRELSLVDQVAKVELWGKQQEAIYVEFSREKLLSMGLSQDAVYQKLQQQNTVESAGKVRVGRDYVRIDSPAGIGTVDDIGAMILREKAGGDSIASLLHLRNVATVSRENVSPTGKILRHNGEEGIALAISTTSGGNVLHLGKLVSERLAQLQAQTPIGLEVEPIIFQPTAVKKSIDSFIDSLVMALVIVVLVLLVFMGRRAGLIIGAVLLITVVATFILMDFYNVALERISLGALIIALGMLVDNAIVITEGMMVRIQAGEDRMKAARESVATTIWPLLGATVIAILAFAAIGASQDSTGEFCRSLFQVMMYSLTLSWITAITITPLLCYWFIPSVSDVAVTDNDGGKDPYGSGIFKFYRKILEASLQKRWLTMAVMGVLLVLALIGFSQLKGSFFPKSTMPKFMIHYWLPEGSDIRQTSADMQQVEQFLLQDEKVTGITSFIGAGAPRFLLTYSVEKDNSSYGLLMVSVNDHHDISALMDKAERYINDEFPDALPKLQRFNLGPSPKSSIEVRFSGEDPVVLRGLSEQVKQILNKSGADSIRDDWRERVKVVRPIYSENQAQFAGIDRADLNEALETNFTGTRVGLYRESDELIPIYSRAPERERKDVAQIGNIQIWSPSVQSFIQMQQVVSGFETGWDDAQIHRLDRKRTLTVGGEPKPNQLASEMLMTVIDDINAIELPLGYEMVWGGEYESSANAQAALGSGLPKMFLMMVLVTILLFSSLRHPLIIWLTVPLAVIGVSAGLLITNEPFGFMPLLGFLSLTGMLIKNAIVLIDQINLELEGDGDPWEGMIMASLSRCRPVMMAAGTTVLGMLPLLMDDFFIGMAVTIMAGLTFASILTLIVVPVLYSIIFRVNKGMVTA